MTVAREALALEAAFWAQLPGNFPMRPRKAPITSRNFAAMTNPKNRIPSSSMFQDCIQSLREDNVASASRRDYS
jgi:hypothetical protein